MAAPIPPTQQLAELSEAAYRLGVAFAAEAEREGTTARGVEFFQLFDRCFFSYRVAVGLQLRLRQAERASATEARAEREDAEHERRNREPDDRDREFDRERETASLPTLLRTLNGVAADAAALPGPEPAALPTLRELLARFTSAPAPAARAKSSGLRARLSGSGAATTVLTRPSPPKPGAALPPRRATGPPRH